MRIVPALICTGLAALLSGCGSPATSGPGAGADTPRTMSLAPPPAAAWRATASEPPEEQYAPALAIDGRLDTRWSSPASDPQWLQIDLGQEADLCGLTLHWETAFASAYTIQLSTDGTNWTDVYATDQGDGLTDDLFFAPARARYVRLLGRQRATQWGHSLWEITLKGPADQPLVSRPEGATDGAHRLLDGRTDTVWEVRGPEPILVDLDLRAPRALGGVRIDWGDAYASNLTASVSDDGTQWRALGDVRDSEGLFDLVLAPRTEARHLRLQFEGFSRPGGIALRELTLRGPDEPLTQAALYRLAAAKAPRGHYPLQFRDEQVYWTLAALPGDRREALFDEYGNLEPWQGASQLMPYLFTGQRLWSAADAVVTQRLADGFLPVPTVEWSLPGTHVTIDALAAGTTSNSAVYVRYRLHNTGGQPLRGRFFLALRPVQVNPTWQHGGLSPIHALVFASESNLTSALVNGREQVVALTPPDAVGVRPFSYGDVVRELAHGLVPAEAAITNQGEYLSGAFAFELDLAPGAARSIVVALPLHRTRAEVDSFRRAAAGRNPGDVFEQRRQQVTAQWRRSVERVVLDLPDSAVEETVKSQLAYILGNMDGLAIQPGSRNYKRSWMRDGGVTSIALLRMGITEPVRRYLDWYAERVQPDGLVPPILNNDGAINDGYGSEKEYDSQGQFVHALLEYYRLTGDRDFLAGHFRKIELALRHLVFLREQTLAPDYLAQEPARERFAGILPPSFSHEGYNPPMHSYWDDFWALKGWKDGEAACEIMGRPDLARWCREQYTLLREATRRTIDATMAYKGIDFIPGCADKGDFDATSTAIALSPCGEMDTLPQDALRRTFARYVADVQKRLQPGSTWVYTPYEARNISALVELGERDHAVELLDFLISCRRPAAWNHLAEVVVSDVRKGTYIGDMPHTWVGSDLVNAVRQMIVQEEPPRLALLKGVPERWVTEGDGLRVERLPTHYGPLNLRAQQFDRILTVRLAGPLTPPEGIEVYWPRAGAPLEVTVNGQAWKDFDARRARVPAGAREIVARW